MSTKIEWSDDTWNPIVGCTPCSPGCDNCYASGVAAREMQPAHEGLTIGRKWNGTIRPLPDRLEVPLAWRKPRKVFVCSMSDLFHTDVPVEFVRQVFDTMAAAPHITFQVLTKRPQRMAALLNDERFYGDPLPNVWLGTSIESGGYTFRTRHLERTPAAVRFLSMEPLIRPAASVDLTGIHWVIVGGESGPGARPMHPQWVRDLRDRCQAAGVAFFFKQRGAWTWEPQMANGSTLPPHAWLKVDGTFCHGDNIARATGDEWTPMWRVGKHDAGRDIDGRTWSEFPQLVPA